MAYNRRRPVWKNYPDVSTPILAEDLNYIEDGLVSAAGVADSALTSASSAASRAEQAITNAATAQSAANAAQAAANTAQSSATAAQGSASSAQASAASSASAAQSAASNALAGVDSTVAGNVNNPSATRTALDGRYPTLTATDARAEALAIAGWAAAWDSGSTSRLREFFARNTGPRVAISGTPITGTVTITSQADANAIVGKEIQGGIYINVPDIELRDFRIKGDGRYALVDFGPNASRTYIHHAEFDGQQSKDTNAALAVSAGGGPSNLRVEWNNFHDLNDASHVRPGSTHKYNFVHDPLIWNTALWGTYNPAIHPHTDGFQWLRGAGETVSRNFIDVPYKSATATPNINSCLIIKTDVAAIDSVTVTENYLNGGTRTVMVNDGGFGLPTNVSFDKNRFGPDFNDGIWQYSNVSSMVFGTNTWAQTKQNVPTTNGSLGYRSTMPANDPDPFGFGCVMTNFGYAAAAAWPTANEARYVRALSGGLINGIEFHIGVSSGNVSVGVYRGRGKGLTHMPYELVATSGTVACPAAGAARIAIPETWVEPGDYLAMSCDNVTMQILLFSGTASSIFRPMGATSGASHPLPANAPSPGAPGFRMPVLVGTFV